MGRLDDLLLVVTVAVKSISFSKFIYTFSNQQNYHHHNFKHKGETFVLPQQSELHLHEPISIMHLALPVIAPKVLNSN